MNKLYVNRTQVLAAATLFLLVFAVAYHVWADWGLITIHARNEPLGKVIASMERQGHAKIQTDMPGDTPVTMDVVRVHVTDAVQELSVVTESRWMFLYFAADTKTAVQTAETSWFGGQHPDGWKMVSFPIIANMLVPDPDDAPAAPPDPRTDVWTPKLAAPAGVQDFFTEAAALTNASFAFPTDWNPTVKSTPHPGVVDHVIPKLVSSAGGHEDELFFLSKPPPRDPTRNADRGPGGPGGFGGGGDLGANQELMAEHVQAEINRLPPQQRADAQSTFDSERAFRDSLKDMTDDQRREAWLQHMQDPQVQQMMMNRMDGRDAQMNHDQRMQHYQNMVNRKLTAMGKM